MTLRTARHGMLVAAVSLIVLVRTSPTGAIPPTIVVSSTADAGPGSLRQAILDANARPGVDEIVFFLGGNAPHIIEPLSPLPAITGPWSSTARATPTTGRAGRPRSSAARPEERERTELPGALQRRASGRVRGLASTISTKPACS